MPITRLFSGVCVALALLLGSGARAELYKWVDDKGVTHYGDRIPPEYSKQGSSQLDKRGVVTKKTEPALTPEQRAAAKAEAERLKEDLKQAEVQQRQDIALINTYSTEAEIDMARDRRVAQIEQVIVQARHHDSELQQRAKVVLQEYERAKAPSKKAVAETELIALANQRRAMRAAIAKLNTDKQDVIAQFDLDKLRYREIKTNGITSTRLSSVARRTGDDRVTELPIAATEAVVTNCVNEWRDSSAKIGDAYAVSARLLARGNREELIVEGRARSVHTGRNQVRRWTCVLNADRGIDKRETDIRKALAAIGAQY